MKEVEERKIRESPHHDSFDLSQCPRLKFLSEKHHNSSRPRLETWSPQLPDGSSPFHTAGLRIHAES
ncbi:hypothetical protein E2C01_083291 [Portunus trituberculatus]|uniref:Uncharacterized protein n=1 Tax=Portunus trituberculatus TaxID=210409 RepID=A0A5B7IUR4_PORTR|nr:hypothetical protein [Portunus trituberculatus]